MDFKPFVDKLFKKIEKSSHPYETLRRNPVTGGCWVKGLDRVKPQKEEACRRLVARRWFAWDNPGLPRLPLSQIRRHPYKMKQGITWVVAEYDASLECNKYDTFRHPDFTEYARGVMASPLAPDFIKNDPQLLKDYPPRPLKGLGSGMVWTDPNKRSRRRRRR
jgi:hypothetical protein